MKQDLFGNPIKEKKKKSRLEKQLAKLDQETFDERLARIKYVDGIAPKGYSMMASMEIVFLFHEAETAYINGAFIATIMLAQAFIEQRLQSYLVNKDVKKASNWGLKAIVDYLRDNHLLNELLIDKIDHLRQTRNPFSHLKPTDHPYALSQRIYHEMKEPVEILEKEAREALALMYTIFMAKLY